MPILTSVSGGSLDFLIDTHVLVWVSEDSSRLSRDARAAIVEPRNRLWLSAVTAWEFADLRARHRLPEVADLDTLIRIMRLTTLDVPADIWRRAAALPYHHGDPMDRMLVAHAIEIDMTLITADITIQGYPLKTLW